MYEGEPLTWVYMGFALVILIANVLWIRRALVKIFALVVLISGAWLHASPIGGLNNLHRDIRIVERELQKGKPTASIELLGVLQDARAIADHVAFDLWIGMTAGIVLAAVPTDAISRLSGKGNNSDARGNDDRSRE